MRKVRKRIGFIFQSPDSYFVTKKVLDEVMFSLLNFSVAESDARERARMALDEFDLSGYEERDISTLSGGEKQRLMLSSVFALEPDVIILDEAYAFLDSDAKESLNALLERKKSEGKTIISVTHDAYVSALSERIILLREGTVAADARADEILSDIPLLLSASVTPRLEDLYASRSPL